MDLEAKLRMMKFPLRFSRFQVMASAGVFYDKQVSQTRGMDSLQIMQYVKELAYIKKIDT
jgi:hypothetical protein